MAKDTGSEFVPTDAQRTERDAIMQQMLVALGATRAELQARLGIDKGFYRDNRLEVTIHPGGLDANPIKDALSGAADIGQVGGIEQVCTAVSEGLPLRAIAAIHRDTPHALISLSTNPIESPADFKGKTIAVAFGHGVPLSTVSAVLAHKKIETTKIYVRLDGREKREAVALLDPKPGRLSKAPKNANGFSLTGIPEGPQLGSDLARNGPSTPNSPSRFPSSPPRVVVPDDGRRKNHLQGAA